MAKNSPDTPNVGGAKKRTLFYTLSIGSQPEHEERRWIDISALEGETEKNTGDVECRIALDMLLERFSRINLFADHPQFRQDNVLQGLQSLVVRCVPASGATPVASR